MKNPYKTPGITKNKEIKKQRKKPLPLSLMGWDNREWLKQRDEYLKGLDAKTK